MTSTTVLQMKNRNVVHALREVLMIKSEQFDSISAMHRTQLAMDRARRATYIAAHQQCMSPVV